MLATHALMKHHVLALGVANAVDNTLTVRSVFVIGPDKKVKLTLTYPAATGRNFDEIIRVLESLQLTAGKGVATPADWKHGDRVVVLPGIDDEAAQARSDFQDFKKLDLPSGKSYLRYVTLAAKEEEDAKQ